MAIPKPPLNKVGVTTTDYKTIFHSLGGIENEPYPVYQSACGRKTFWSNFQTDTIYDKPVSIVGDVTTHLPDPQLESSYI